MTTFKVLRTATATLALGLSACSTTPAPPPIDTTLYTDCASLSNCGFASNVCQYFAIAYSPSNTVASQICTVTCVNDSNCPFGFNGQAGFCAPYAFLGNELAACTPRCFTDRDCPASMVCIDASKLTTGGGLPIGTLICAPG